MQSLGGQGYIVDIYYCGRKNLTHKALYLKSNFSIPLDAIKS